MVHLQGIHHVTAWEDCQDVASSLMTLMRSAIQGDQVGLPVHLYAYNLNIHAISCM